MPSMANITVKKADGTTSVVYTVLAPSAGDKSPSKWRANAASSIPSHRPMVDLTARDNGTKDGRRVTMVGKFPILGTENGVEVVLAIVPLEFTALIPQNVDAAQAAEAVAQFSNFTVDALIRACFTEGYAAT